MEEKRAQKKLVKTKQKAQDIMELKHRNYLKQKARQEVLIPTPTSRSFI